MNIKMSITLPEELIAKIAKESEETGLSRSAINQLALRQYYDGKDVLNSMKDMPAFLKSMQAMLDDKNKQ